MLSYNSNNEPALLLRIADGDEKAFEVFFNHHYPLLRPFIIKFFENEDQIEDALQETFVRVWLNRDQLPEIENVKGWLYTIVSRICLNHIRANITRNKKEDAYSSQAAHHTTIHDKTQLSEIHLLIDKAIRQMPEARRRIFILSREEGMKPAEIAQHLSISVQTVKNVLVVALKEIRTYLVDNGHFISLLSIMLNYF